MNLQALRPLLVSIFAISAAIAVNAQQPAQPAQPVQSQSAPIGQSTAAQNNQNPNSSGANAASPKKVWTNEDVGSLRDHSQISSFDPKNTSPKKNSARNSAPDRQDPARYRQQILKLQNQIPPIDAKIAQLHATLEGDTTNDPNTSSRPYYGVRAGSWQAEMDRLQAKRASILDQISKLEDQARHAGIAPNALP